MSNIVTCGVRWQFTFERPESHQGSLTLPITVLKVILVVSYASLAFVRAVSLDTKHVSQFTLRLSLTRSRFRSMNLTSIDNFVCADQITHAFREATSGRRASYKSETC